MKILFCIKNPSEVLSLLGKIVEDKDVLADDGSNLHMCLCLPSVIRQISDGTFVGELRFEKNDCPSVYGRVSIADIVKRIRQHG